MKRYNGYEAKKSTTRELLPAGGYVARIKAAEELSYDWGEVLLLSFDIDEGERKDFFARDYRAQDTEDKKWRGTFRLTEPRDDGSEKDQWAKRAFNNAVAVLEESNQGYRWDWGPIENGDFSQLKGKLVGVLYRNREWEKDGNTGWTTECCTLIPVEDVRQNTFKMPKDKPLSAEKRKEAAAKSGSFVEIVADDLTDDDLPF